MLWNNMKLTVTIMIFHNSCRSGKAVSCTKEHFELVHFYQIYIGTQNSTALNLKKTFLNNYLNFFFHTFISYFNTR